MATIQGVYVALFGRPADPTGLAYFNGVTKNGADLSAIGDLASTQEYKDRFAGQNNTQIVNSIYQSLFGRDAEAAGLTFFVNALNTGSLNIKNIAIAILDGAQGTDKTIATNKVAAADLYTSHLDTAQEIGSYQGNAAAAQGRAFISTVTTTVPSAAAVDAAILSMQAAGAVGATINVDSSAVGGTVIGELSTSLGYGASNVTTTNNNDTINATKTANDWVVGTSKIDGGLGVDTLNALLNAGGGTVQTDGLKNIEVLNVSTVGAASTIDVAAAAQLTQLWHVANTGAANTNVALNVTGLAQTATFGLKGDLGTATNSVAFTDADASSSVNVALNAAKSTGALTVSDVGTLNISNTGTSSVPLITETKAFVITGDGAFTLAATDSILQTVNASAFTGNLTSDLSGNDALKTVTSGSGNDTLTVGLTHSADIKIDAGAGNDTITVVNEAAVTKAIALTGGAGADSFVFGSTGVYTNNVVLSGTPVAADIAKTLVSISDFDKSADAIKFYVAGGAATGKANLTGADLATISGQSDILAAATKAAELANTNSGTGHVAVFGFGSGADAAVYIYEDANNDGAFNSGDALVKVAGITSVSDLTATNFVLIA